MEKPALAGYNSAMEFLGRATALAVIFLVYWAFGLWGLIVALALILWFQIEYKQRHGHWLGD